jgi:hypothetical protein
MASNKSGVKRKHVTLSVVEKLKILDKVDAGVSPAKIVEESGIGKQTVSDIKRHKEKIKIFVQMFNSGGEMSSRKNVKMPSYEHLEEAVYRWYKQQHSRGEIRGVGLQAAAERLAKHLKITDFAAITEWLWRFLSRQLFPVRK